MHFYPNVSIKSPWNLVIILSQPLKIKDPINHLLKLMLVSFLVQTSIQPPWFVLHLKREFCQHYRKYLKYWVIGEKDNSLACKYFIIQFTFLLYLPWYSTKRWHEKHLRSTLFIGLHYFKLLKLRENRNVNREKKIKQAAKIYKKQLIYSALNLKIYITCRIMSWHKPYFGIQLYGQIRMLTPQSKFGFSWDTGVYTEWVILVIISYLVENTI